MGFSERFSECYVALIALLWEELEDLLQDLTAAECGSEIAIQQRAQALLLELVLLRERAAGEPLRTGTAPSEHAAYCSLIDDVWALLDFQPTDLPVPNAEISVKQAQDRLLLEVVRTGTLRSRDDASLAI